jgi:hypothetical protein
MRKNKTLRIMTSAAALALIFIIGIPVGLTTTPIGTTALSQPVSAHNVK